MLNISEADKDLWRSGQTKKDVVVTFPELNISLTNSDVYEESLELTESIESENNLTFKGCIASKLKISLINFFRDVRNEYIEVSISTLESESIPLFKGYVYEQTNANHEDFVTTLTCYDPLKKALDADVTNWYNGLTFPITLRQMRDSFFLHFNLQHQTTNLINDNLSIAKTITDPNIYGRDIIRDICQLNGVFGQFGRDGVFYYHKLTASVEALYPAEDLYPADDLYPAEANAQERVFKSAYNSISYQPYHTKLISRIIIVNQNGGQGGAAGDTTGDTFYISDNKLAWGVNGNLACQAILGAIKNLSFTPATIKAKGLPYLECGDIIVSNTRVNVVQSYILNRTLDGIQNLIDTFDSDSTQERKPYVLSQATEISTNKAKTETAQSTANGAQSTANTANTRAVNAQNTADNAIWRVSNLEADHVSVQDIQGINARFNNLNASNITAGTLSVNRLNANSVTDVVLANCTGKSMTIYGLNVRQSFQVGSTSAYWMSKTVKDSSGRNITIQYLGR